MALVIIRDQPGTGINYARSPLAFWVNQNEATGTAIRIVAEVFIWTGTPADKPLDFLYQLVKWPNSSGEVIFDLSTLVKSYISNQTPGELTADFNPSVNEVVYLQLRLYWQSNESISIDPLDSNLIPCVQGWTYRGLGINQDVEATRSLKTVTITEGVGSYLWPAFIAEYDRIFIRDDNGGAKFFDFTALDETDTVNQMLQINAGTKDLAGYGLSATSSYKIGGVPSGGDTEEDLLYFNIVCEPRYTPVEVMFIDVVGSWESFTFYKRSDATLTRKDERYMNNYLWPYPSQTLTNPEKPEFYGYNTNGRYNMVLNTGVIQSETANILLEGLMLSNTVLMKSTGVTGDWLPCQVESSDFMLMKGVNAGAFDYTFNFSLAFTALTTSAI